MAFKDDVDTLARDTTSGAAELLQKAASLALKYSGEIAPEEMGTALLAARGDMAPIINLALELKKHSGMATAEDVVWAFLHQHRKSFARSVREAARAIGSGNRVLTYSRSSTVLAAFLEANARGQRFKVYLTEARPGMEGLHLARELAGAGIEVVLGPDSCLASFLKECDLVLSGADAVVPEFFYNKTGTLGLALMANATGVPFYLSVSRDKLLTSEGAFYYHVKDMPSEEIISPVPPGVKVVNRYFEPVPVSLVTRIIGI